MAGVGSKGPSAGAADTGAERERGLQQEDGHYGRRGVREQRDLQNDLIWPYRWQVYKLKEESMTDTRKTEQMETDCFYAVTSREREKAVPRANETTAYTCLGAEEIAHL